MEAIIAMCGTQYTPGFVVLVPFGRPLGAVGEGRGGGRGGVGPGRRGGRCLVLLWHDGQRTAGGRGGRVGDGGGGCVVVVTGKTVEEGTGAAGGATLQAEGGV